MLFMIWAISYGPYRKRLEPYCFILYDIHRVYRRLAIAYNLWNMPKPLATTSKTMLWLSFNPIYPLYTGLMILPFTQGLYFCSGLTFYIIFYNLRSQSFRCPVLLRMSDTRRAVIESWYPLHRVTSGWLVSSTYAWTGTPTLSVRRPHFTFCYGRSHIYSVLE